MLRYCMSILLAAMLAAFSGATMAGTSSSSSTGSFTIAAVGQDEVQQASDQDPNTPPDCKKYPKDTRCGKK